MTQSKSPSSIVQKKLLESMGKNQKPREKPKDHTNNPDKSNGTNDSNPTSPSLVEQIAIDDLKEAEPIEYTSLRIPKHLLHRINTIAETQQLKSGAVLANRVLEAYCDSFEEQE